MPPPLLISVSVTSILLKLSRMVPMSIKRSIEEGNLKVSSSDTSASVPETEKVLTILDFNSLLTAVLLAVSRSQARILMDKNS